MKDKGNCPLGVYIKKDGAQRGSYKCFKDVVENVAEEGWKKYVQIQAKN